MLNTTHVEIDAKIVSLIRRKQLDALVLGDLYNIQYATGVRIPCSHAQSDQVMFAVFIAEWEPIVIVPHCWLSVARQTIYAGKVIAYRPNSNPLAAATELLVAWCSTAGQIGLDSAELSVTTSRYLSNAFSGVTLIDCASDVAFARAVKTPGEVTALSNIAAKIDHVINGHYHHLSADRPKTASVMSESLRVHSLERDITLSGYHAGGRAVLGDEMKHFWPYAPKFGFAEARMTVEKDAIIADVINSENGYWSNASRIAITHDEMNDEQELAFGELVQLREMLIDEIKIGRKCAAIREAVVASANDASISLVTALPLGFSVGVSAMEGPFFAPGDETVIEAGMVFVLDPVVQHGGKFYRSRDTVVVTEQAIEIVNWYKDWREPYLAILEL